MRILHLPMEVGGQIAELCLQLRKLGHQAVGYNWRHNYLKYDQTLLHSDAYEMAKTLNTAIHYFDIFHYHTGYTLYPNKSDIEWIVGAGKKVVMHHRGNDVRFPSKAVKGPNHYNPYVYTGDSLPEDVIAANLAYFARYIDTAIVQDVELYDYVVGYYRHVHILPRPINLERVRPPGRPSKRQRPLVVHAPTSRAFKGTEDIVRIVNQAKRDVPFDFVLLEKMPQTKVLQMMQQADLVIDQINCGMYGNVSVEGMAMSKPVVCYIRPDIASRLPEELPIVSANRDNLYDALIALLRDDSLRQQLGQKGRAYVEAYHDSRQVARQLVEIYASL